MANDAFILGAFWWAVCMLACLHGLGGVGSNTVWMPGEARPFRSFLRLLSFMFLFYFFMVVAYAAF